MDMNQDELYTVASILYPKKILERESFLREVKKIMFRWEELKEEGDNDETI